MLICFWLFCGRKIILLKCGLGSVGNRLIACLSCKYFLICFKEHCCNITFWNINSYVNKTWYLFTTFITWITEKSFYTVDTHIQMQFKYIYQLEVNQRATLMQPKNAKNGAFLQSVYIKAAFRWKQRFSLIVSYSRDSYWMLETYWIYAVRSCLGWTQANLKKSFN